jgi:hypothetical protein
VLLYPPLETYFSSLPKSPFVERKSGRRAFGIEKQPLTVEKAVTQRRNLEQWSGEGKSGECSGAYMERMACRTMTTSG